MRQINYTSWFLLIESCPRITVSDLRETEWVEKEVEGDICGRARFGYGRADQGVVYAAHKTYTSASIWLELKLKLFS